MDLLGGKSYKNGIDFSFEDEGKKQIISARKLESGEITTSFVNTFTKEKNNSISKKIFSAILAFLVAMGSYFLESQGVKISTSTMCIICLIVFWVSILLFCFFEHKKLANEAVLRYHSAEHKVLNYYYRTFKLPQSVEDIRLEENIYIFCGSTIVAVISVFVSLIVLSLFVLKWPIGIIFSILTTLLMWAKGKCDFIQKFFIKEPTHQEMELAICAMKALAKKKENVQ